MAPTVQALIDAANKGDLAAFLAGFTDDSVVDGTKRRPRNATNQRLGTLGEISETHHRWSAYVV